MSRSKVTGRYITSKWKWRMELSKFQKVLGSVMVFMFLVIVGGTIGEKHPMWTELYAGNVFAAELKRDTVAELEEKLIHIVWDGESRKFAPKNGEVLKVFDPSKSTYKKCTEQFNRDIDCISWGPMQIKVGTLQYYWPQVYGTEITEIEALNVALDLRKSQRFFVDCSVKVRGCAMNWTAAKNSATEVQKLVDEIRSRTK